MWMTKSSNSRKLAGAPAPFNTTRESVHERLQEITEGRGPDVVIEAVGTPEDIPGGGRRSCIYRQGCLHRVCERTGHL